MDLIVHLSDLHFDEEKRQQTALFEALVAALERERRTLEPSRILVVITGDVFDSSAIDSERAARKFADLFAKMTRSLGGGVRAIILPGNHDRRRRGLFGPHRGELFEALKDALDPELVHVAGCRTPFLAEVVPDALHGLDADFIAYDSTFLPSGLISAGGMIRHEDLLQAYSHLAQTATERPIVFLVHHHLIPTPLTDVSRIDVGGSAGLTRWVLGTALPALVSNADREELTMTALGAGTALSMLHSFGRPVLLLHGHKHFPTARLVRGVNKGSGDILMASAGSAGRRERIHADRHPDDARLWPSFNLVRIEGTDLRVEAVSFHPRRPERPVMRRDLVRARREGVRWEAQPISARASDPTPRIELDQAHYELEPSHEDPRERWDFTCVRRLDLLPGAKLKRYVEIVHALPRGAKLKGTPGKIGRRRVDLIIGAETRYTVKEGLCRTFKASRRAYADGAAFEWVGLMSRYGGKTVRLSMSRKHLGEVRPFASLTDLQTGRERPLSLEFTRDGFEAVVLDCAPRSMLRIYWPLER